jgi:hypothetical protein
MAHHYSIGNNIFYGSNSKTTGRYGSPMEGTGLQPDLTVNVEYRGSNWSGVEDVAGNKRREAEERLERERLAAERRIAAYKKTFKYRFLHAFGLA